MDAIFAGLSMESDNNSATIANKVLDMAQSAVSKNTATLNAASNSLAKNGIKVSF